MALTSQSLFLYGFEITQFNSSIDFDYSTDFLGPRMATLTQGFYSLSGLLEEVRRALQVADDAVSGGHTYTVTANRTIAGGTQNRVTIDGGAGFKLNFFSGPRSASAADLILGFLHQDYTGSSQYTGTNSAGTTVLTNAANPSYRGYTFLSPDYLKKNFGKLNISASGKKEVLVFSVQTFWQVQYKYITQSESSTDWIPLLTWMMQQREIDFTPEVSSPNTFYTGTLETTSEDGQALAYRLREMLDQNLPNFYDTGLMKFRVKVS